MTVPQSQNRQRSPATPAVLLNRSSQIRPKSERDPGISVCSESLKEVGDKIGELQQTGEEPREDLKQGFENSWEILTASFTKAKSEFERGYKEGRKDS